MILKASENVLELEKRIRPQLIEDQGFPRPKRVTMIASPDHTGDEAYFVYLVFPNTTPDSALSWRKIKAMVDWVRATIWEADGERHWPYVRVKRERDMKGEPA